jgi:hypothetical protein
MNFNYQFFPNVEKLTERYNEYEGEKVAHESGQFALLKGKRKDTLLIVAPPLTLDQAKGLEYRDELYSFDYMDSTGYPSRVRVNGRPLTWKRSPERVKVPWKYGLYEYGYIEEYHLSAWFLMPSDLVDRAKEWANAL